MRLQNICILSFIALLALTSNLLADPRIEDVFQSTHDAMGSEIDGTKIFAIACAAVGLIVVLVLVSKIKSGGGTGSGSIGPRALNHQGKLLKELTRELNLKAGEVRQLKSLSETSSLKNPLTLMLCPSLLTKAAREQPAKVDRRAIASLAKRLTAPTQPTATSVKR